MPELNKLRLIEIPKKIWHYVKTKAVAYIGFDSTLPKVNGKTHTTITGKEGIPLQF